MLNVGPWEFILILIVVLIVFGPRRLPEVARTLGKAVGEFRKASTGVQRFWDEATREVPGGKIVSQVAVQNQTEQGEEISGQKVASSLEENLGEEISQKLSNTN